jgi:hypothetical protein
MGLVKDVGQPGSMRRWPGLVDVLAKLVYRIAMGSRAIHAGPRVEQLSRQRNIGLLAIIGSTGKTAVAGGEVGHGVLPVDDDRSRRIGGPDR